VYADAREEVGEESEEESELSELEECEGESDVEEQAQLLATEGTEHVLGTMFSASLSLRATQGFSHRPHFPLQPSPSLCQLPRQRHPLLICP